MKDIKKILIIRLSSLGDIVLITPVIRAVKHKFPQTEVYFLTKSIYSPLLKGNLHLSGIIELKDKDTSGLLSTLRKVRELNFDLVIDLHSNLRSFFLKNFSKAKLKLKYNKKWFNRFLMVHFKGIEVSSVHTVDSYLNCLERLDIYSFDRMPELYLDEESQKFADQLLKNLSQDEILVGVAPGAKWENKRWGEGNFTEAIRVVNNRIKAKFVLIGGKEDEELIKGLKNLTKDINFIEAIGLSFPQLSGIISRCQVILTNDSGPMHMAVALKVPVVAIFGPTHPKLGFFPLGEKDVIFCADVECSPCSLHGKKRCYKKSKICMEQISPEMVTDKVIEIIKNKGKV